MGTSCKVELQSECDSSAYFDGAIDDLAFFAGALTDAEVKERWDQPLTSRVQAGVEPRLILFYDFDNPSLANIPNLGTASNDYDLIRGHVAEEGSSSTSYYDPKYFDSFLKQPQTFRSPQFVPAWALPRASSDVSTPVVTSAAAGATISIEVPGLSSPETFTAPPSPWTTTFLTTASNGRTVHIVPRGKPVGPTIAHLTSFSGLEDTPLVLQVAGMSELGLCMQAVITTRPSKGKLFAVATGYDPTSQLIDAIEITTAGHVLEHNQTGNYLVFQPETNQVGSPYVAFNVSFRLAEEPALMSEPVEVTIKLSAVDDVPTTYAFSYTLAEASRKMDGTMDVTGGAQVVQLFATDDPNEQIQPLELFITSLPTKGKLQVQQTDGSIKAVTAAYDMDAAGTVISQYLNDTTVGLATFTPLLSALNPGHFYHNSNPSYTESIEATVSTPVYITGVEIGSSAHSLGGVVAVRVKTPQGTWLPLYTGTPLHKLGAEQGTQYWKWSPEVCQLNFKSSEIRVEIDTSTETGIFVGAIDYVKVVGTSEQQLSALPFVVGANTSLIYQADAFETGSDSFTYAASDCPGDPLRMSAPSTVKLTIINSNNVPFSAWPQDDALDVDTPGRISFNAFDHDSPPPATMATGFGMTFNIVKLPNGVKLSTNPAADPNVSLDGLPVVQGDAIVPTRGFPFPPSWYYQLELTAIASTCGESAMTYTISDQTTTSQLYTKKINVICPRVCSLSNDVDWEESKCDQSTLTRSAIADWRNFSLSGNASGSCDLPRAPYLPKTVKFDCDAIDLDSTWAVNLIVAGALLAAGKVALLVYAVVHREAPIYKKAQVSFVSFTIVGGIMADFAPILLLGPVVTWRCHLFASWLLIATTLLYGPLVLKSYRVWRVIDNPKLKNIKEQPLKTLARLLAFITLEVIAALVMGFASPIHAQTYDFELSEYASTQRTRCQDSAFTWVAYALIALPIVAGLYLSYKTRNIQGGHTETKPILFAFYTLAVVWGVVFAMLQVFGGTNIIFELGLVSTSILLVSTVSVFTLMIPKMLYHRGIFVEQVMANSTQTGTEKRSASAASGMFEASEEIAELKAELSENRATIFEQRESIAELKEQMLKAGGSEV